MSAAGIARQLGATRQGNNWRCACPRGCGYGLSFCDGPDGRCYLLFWRCVIQEIMLRSSNGLPDDDGGDSRVARCVCHAMAPSVAHARQIYDSGSDERIAVYLHSREIRLLTGSGISRGTAPARHPPAGDARMSNGGGEIGRHLFAPGSAGKANLPKDTRECRGVITAGRSASRTIRIRACRRRRIERVQRDAILAGGWRRFTPAG